MTVPVKAPALPPEAPASFAERLWLNRHYHGKTLQEAAKRWGVQTLEYQMWERGEKEIPDWMLPFIPITPLTIQEMMILFRRRKGWTQAEVGRRMGLSFTMIRHLESGRDSPRRLIEFWKKTHAEG